MRKVAIAGAVCLALSTAAPAQTVIYVDADATSGAKDGSSWTDAYTDLQNALATATGINEIWVAEGTYTPTDTGDRTVSFQLVEGVALYGGFAGTEAARDERDWVAHEAILTGDLNGDDDLTKPLDDPLRNNGENSYHVVIGADDATLDGFTVRGGSADRRDTPPVPESSGGGMYNDYYTRVTGLMVANCTFSGNWAFNYGGGIHSDTRSSFTVTNCTFSGNSAGFGGAMWNRSCSPTIIGCTFSANMAVYTGPGGSGRGGAVRNIAASSPSITDCTFTGNSAVFGGGMANTGGSSPVVVECVFFGNVAANGGAMYDFDGSSPTVTNCVFSGNTAIAGLGIGFVSGGAIYNRIESSPAVTNCTFSGNSAVDYGGGIYSDDTPPVVTNCILWGNSAPTGPEIGGGVCTVSHSVVAQIGGFTDAGGNINADPMFVDPGRWDDNGTPGDELDDFWVDGDYHLKPGSPCIDAADGDAASEFDIEGNPRHDDPRMPNRGKGAVTYADIGAYEFQGETPSPVTGLAVGEGCHVRLPGAQTGAHGATALALCLLVSCLALRRRRRPA